MRNAVLGFGAGVLACWLASSLLRRGSGSDGRGAKTYDLIVTMQLNNAEQVPEFLRRFETLRRYCIESEPETLTYEAFVDPSAADTVVIVERYTRPEALTDIHHKSQPFAEFRTWVGESGMVKDKRRQIGWVSH